MDPILHSFPAGTRRNNNVFTTSTRRRRRRVDVVKTLSLRHYCVMCPLGFPARGPKLSVFCTSKITHPLSIGSAVLPKLHNIFKSSRHHRQGTPKHVVSADAFYLLFININCTVLYCTRAVALAWIFPARFARINRSPLLLLLRAQ